MFRDLKWKHLYTNIYNTMLQIRKLVSAPSYIWNINQYRQIIEVENLENNTRSTEDWMKNLVNLLQIL